MLITSVVSLLIMIYFNIHGDTNLRLFLKSAANSWGMFILMLLIGYSIVAIPQAHWRTTDWKVQTNYFRFRAFEIREEQNETLHNFNDHLMSFIYFYNHKEIQSDKSSEIDKYYALIQDLVHPSIFSSSETTLKLQIQNFN